MIIRKAEEKDAPSVRQLLVQLDYPRLTEREVLDKIGYYSQASYTLLVAEMDEKVVGFISLHWFDIFHSAGKIGRVSAFCVDDRHRSQGIGKELLQSAEELFNAQGCSKIEVTSNIRRTLTHEFYLRSGYVEDSKRFTKFI